MDLCLGAENAVVTEHTKEKKKNTTAITMRVVLMVDISCVSLKDQAIPSTPLA